VKNKQEGKLQQSSEHLTQAQADIKRAYHKLALKLHPDKNPGDEVRDMLAPMMTSLTRSNPLSARSTRVVSFTSARGLSLKSEARLQYEWRSEGMISTSCPNAAA
jgi:curved DNA-binding protein CbpA